MSKNKKHEEEHQSAEAGGLRWLLTYADLVTLLLACFVVLFATREPPKPETIQRLIEAARTAFKVVGGGPFSEGRRPIPGGAGILTGGRAVKEDLVDKLPLPPGPKGLVRAEEIIHGKPTQTIGEGKYACPPGFSCDILPSGTRVSIPGDLLFDSGSTALRKSALESLDRLGQAVVASQGEVRFEGHTDSDPISSAAFPSNWELSGARAAAVARHFVSKWGISAKRVVIVGYGEYRPNRCAFKITPKECNKDARQKQRNRRVTLTIQSGDVSGPAAGGDKREVLP